MLFQDVNRDAHCEPSGVIVNFVMSKKRKELESWQKADAARLKEIYGKKTKLTQETFGHLYELGSQGLVWQYLNGHIPLSHESAYKFARGLDCSIADFSPRLAAEVARYAEIAMPAKRATRKTS